MRRPGFKSCGHFLPANLKSKIKAPDYSFASASIGAKNSRCSLKIGPLTLETFFPINLTNCVERNVL